MLYAIVAVLALILDQAVKYWISISITLNNGSVPLIPGVISLVNIHNNGAAFGILENARWFFILIAVIFVIVVIMALYKNAIRKPLGRWSAILVMAGAVGNCIDRVLHGYVVDMFRLDFMNFAIFNVADIFITVCGILFCVYIIFTDEFKNTKSTDDDTQEKTITTEKKTPKSVAATPKASVLDQDGVRTYKPKTQNSSKKPTAPSKSAISPKGSDPFAEWESLPTLTNKTTPAEDTFVASSVTSDEAVSKAPPKSNSANPKTEFSLEDIMAEYSSK